MTQIKKKLIKGETIQESFTSIQPMDDTFHHIDFYLDTVCYKWVFYKYKFTLAFTLSNEKGFAPPFGATHYNVNSFMDHNVKYFINKFG